MTNEELPQIGLSDEVFADLKKSGLEPHHIRARTISSAELAATRTSVVNGVPPEGYVIPYFDLSGKPVQFYRVRILNPLNGIKYKQPSKAPNHIYFPPGLTRLLKQDPTYILIVEGEKKAACACANGFPAVAVSGVDSWRNRIITLPGDTVLTQSTGSNTIIAKLPSGLDNAINVYDTGPLAKGMNDLIDYVRHRRIDIIIVYDSDMGGVKPEVQTAATKLGYELRYRGLPVKNIRQIVLPCIEGKVGIDDYIVANSAKDFAALLRGCKAKRIAFPRHPNPQVFVSSKLQKSKMSRKETQDVALAILIELESRGRRIRTKGAGELHYFDEQAHTLMKVVLANPKVPLHELPFGEFLYREFNISASDRKVVEWLATQYTGEPGIFVTDTHKVLARPRDMPDCIALQISDAHFVIVTPNRDEPLIICENGDHEILFEQGQVEPLDPVELEIEFLAHIDGTPKMYWADVLSEMNFKPPTLEDGEAPKVTNDQLRTLAALLYYISPWLHRWRGTQLPIELIIGEAGSGKSSLYGLRQEIITGQIHLSNVTNDIRDWYAGITNRGGLYVLDNIRFTGTSKDYHQRLSDEICRLITEPDPHVEMRKLYTTNESVSLPVNTTFAFTAIEQPFFNTDLIQRSAIFELEAIRDSHDSNWAKRQMNRFGGRLKWVAHHLEFLHKFLNLALRQGHWDENYKAKHRLANYEQCLQLAAKVFGLDIDWIPEILTQATNVRISEADWAMKGLKDFIKYMKDKYNDYATFRISTQDIAEWAEGHDMYHKNAVLVNPWRLGRYLGSHRAVIESSLGLYVNGKRNNRNVYAIKE